MGKKMGNKRKNRTAYQDGYGNEITNLETIELRKECIRNYMKVLEELDNDKLLEVANSVCGSDYAIKSFKKDPKLNRGLLEKAIRRSYAIGAFNHREKIIDDLTSYGY